MRIAVADIGGTNIKAGIWENDVITEVAELPTEAKRGGTHVVNQVKKLLHGFGSFDAIGISTAGQVDSKRGVIIYANENIPGYTGTPLKEILEAEFAVPVAVLNDVNAAAIGEAYYGAGKDSNDFLCLTYGTGVGGAIVMNGRVYTGAGFSAGEFGAMVIHPEDRNAAEDMFSGCYERYASTTALVQRAQWKYPGLRNGREIFAHFDEPEVRRLVACWADEVVCGLVTLIHIFNPSTVILGGGIMERPEVLALIREKLYPNIMESFRGVKLVAAELGNRAGMLGASQEALEEYHERCKGKTF